MPFVASRLIVLRCLRQQVLSNSNNTSQHQNYHHLSCSQTLYHYHQNKKILNHENRLGNHQNVVCLLISYPIHPSLKSPGTRNYSTAESLKESKFDTTKPFAYYEILGVPRNAKQADIKKAYFRMAKVYHPDVSSDEFARENFDKITEAYTTLMDLTQRYFYDRHGHTSEELKKKGTPSIFDWKPKYSIYEETEADSSSKAVEDWFTAQGHVKEEDLKFNLRQRLKNMYVEFRFGMAYYDFPWKIKSMILSLIAWALGLTAFVYTLGYGLSHVSYRKPIPIYLKWENDEIYDILWYAGARKNRPSDQSKGGMYHMPKVSNPVKSEYSHTIYSNTRSRTKSKNKEKYRRLQKELRDASARSWKEERLEQKRKRIEALKAKRNDGFTVTEG